MNAYLGHQLEIALVHFVNLEGACAARVNAQQDKLGRARHPPRVERRKVNALGHVLDELAAEGECEGRERARLILADAQLCYACSSPAQVQKNTARTKRRAPEGHLQMDARHLFALACPRAPLTTMWCRLFLWLPERLEEGRDACELAAAVDDNEEAGCGCHEGS